jgi:hypothetical protein
MDRVQSKVSIERTHCGAHRAIPTAGASADEHKRKLVPFMASNDEVERRGVATTCNEADLSQPSTPSATEAANNATRTGWIFTKRESATSNRSSNDEVERRGDAATRNEGDLSQSSIPSLAQRRRDPRSLQPLVRRTFTDAQRAALDLVATNYGRCKHAQANQRI